MNIFIKITHWDEAKSQVMPIRHEIFVKEQKVPEELEWDEFQGSFWKVPHTEEILNALESSYALKGDPAAAADEKAKALAHAAPYATDRVFSDHWVPILSKMETLVREPSKIISLPANRAARRAGKK
jgi:hypothetical protein